MNSGFGAAGGVSASPSQRQPGTALPHAGGQAGGDGRFPPCPGTCRRGSAPGFLQPPPPPPESPSPPGRAPPLAGRPKTPAMAARCPFPAPSPPVAALSRLRLSLWSAEGWPLWPL